MCAFICKGFYVVGDLVVSKHIRSFGCSTQQIMVIKFCGTITDPIYWKIKQQLQSQIDALILQHSGDEITKESVDLLHFSAVD